MLIVNQDHRKSEGAGGAVALEKWYRCLTWLAPTVEKFARAHKFTLGDRLMDTSLDILTMLIEATYTRAPVGLLRQVNIRLTQLRFLVRLAFDLRQLNQRRYEWCVREVDEVGRLIGGWLRALSESAKGDAHGTSRT
jgi:hypothetical protein